MSLLFITFLYLFLLFIASLCISLLFLTSLYSLHVSIFFYFSPQLSTFPNLSLHGSWRRPCACVWQPNLAKHYRTTLSNSQWKRTFVTVPLGARGPSDDRATTCRSHVYRGARQSLHNLTANARLREKTRISKVSFLFSPNPDVKTPFSGVLTLRFLLAHNMQAFVIRSFKVKLLLTTFILFMRMEREHLPRLLRAHGLYCADFGTCTQLLDLDSGMLRQSIVQSNRA